MSQEEKSINLNPEHTISQGESLEALPDSEHPEELISSSGLKPENELSAGEGSFAKKIDQARREIDNSPEKEQYEQKEIKNMAEFLEVLEDRILESDDEEEKIKLAFHLIKIKGALHQAKIKPGKLSLMGLSAEDLVEYNHHKRKLEVRRDILDDFEKNQKFFATIFSEVQIEKDKNIRDVGFQLLSVQKKISINKEIDKKERQATERVFDKLGINTALKLYNYVKPEKLADYFLEKEIEKRKDKINFLNSSAWALYLSRLFKKGAPELYKKLKTKNYSWRAKVKDVLTLESENTR